MSHRFGRPISHAVIATAVGLCGLSIRAFAEPVPPPAPGAPPAADAAAPEAKPAAEPGPALEPPPAPEPRPAPRPRPGPAGPHGPEGRPAPRPAELRPPQALQGTVEGFNLAPDGQYESLTLKTADGKTSQVNFPPRSGSSISSVAAVGSTISLMASPTPSMPERPIYELSSLTGKDGQEMKLARPGEERSAHVEGSVKALNFARDGRANGVVLDNDTLVHTGPEAFEQLKLAVGQKVSADGLQTSVTPSHNVINAETVNGKAVDRPAPPSEAGAGGPPPHPLPREGKLPTPPRP